MYKSIEQKHESSCYSSQIVLLKETRDSYFCVTPKNHRSNVFLMKKLKSPVTKKVIACFYDLGEKNLKLQLL